MRVRSLALFGFALLWACGAPRDPDLEKRAVEAQARHERELAASAPAAPVLPATAIDELPLKTFTNDEMARILGRVPGAGPKLSAELRTEQGVITCELDEAGAPQTVTNFIGLATGQIPWRDGGEGPTSTRPFYDGLTFHRVVANYIIQTGNPGRRVGGGPGYRLPRETGAARHFAKPGALAMIDLGDDSHGSQLFITARADANLAARYAAFGHCDEVPLVTRISNGEMVPSADGSASSIPRNPVKIFNVNVTRGP